VKVVTPLSGQDKASRDLRKDAIGPAPEFRQKSWLGEAARRLWWIRYYTAEFLMMLAGYIPMHSARMFLYRRVFGMTIGEETSIHCRCRFYNPRDIKVGCYTAINNDVLLDGRSGLQIGSSVSISELVVILTLEHDLDHPEFATVGGRVTIEDFVFIGTRAIILPGVTLGKGCAVGAGAVVTRNVEPYAIVAGNPARFVRFRSTNLTYKLRYRKPLG
jgi:acetyltransferase-like isoleucine patch superfamily enzyme